MIVKKQDSYNLSLALAERKSAYRSIFVQRLY